MGDEGVDARMVYLLLNDLGVTLFEVVKVVLHHVDFADLLRDCAKKEERVESEQLSCQAGDAEAMRRLGGCGWKAIERTSMLHFVALRLELRGVVAEQVELVSDKVEKVCETCGAGVWCSCGWCTTGGTGGGARRASRRGTAGTTGNWASWMRCTCSSCSCGSSLRGAGATGSTWRRWAGRRALRACRRHDGTMIVHCSNEAAATLGYER